MPTATDDQPIPDGTGSDVAGLVLEDLEATCPEEEVYTVLQVDIEARVQKGEREYGERLRSENGRDPLQDAYQETLDQMLYLRQAMAEGRDVEAQYWGAVKTAAEIWREMQVSRPVGADDTPPQQGEISENRLKEKPPAFESAPWTAERPDESGYGHVWASDGDLVVSVCDAPVYGETAYDRARLIGAAPELLNACKAIVEAIDPDSGYAKYSAAVDASRQAERALDAAGGGADG